MSKMLYLVGQWKDAEPWHVQGIFSSEKDAVKACRTDTYFVMRVEADTPLPHEKVEAVCFYPLADQVKAS